MKLAGPTTGRRLRWLLAPLAVLSLLAAGCGNDDSSGPTGGSDEASEDALDEASTGDDDGDSATSVLTACELFPKDEAEAIVGAELELLGASDDYRCSYVEVTDGASLVGALVSISPFPATVDDLQMLRDAYAPETVEDLIGLGDAAIYHDDGPVHDVQFVKNGVWVTVVVTGLADGGDVRPAEMAIAEAAAARL